MNADVLAHATDAMLAAMSAPDEATGYAAAREVLTSVPATLLLEIAAALAVQAQRHDVLLSLVLLAENRAR